uniref:Uncharacterized protein n=1 Tax=Oryza meridionalis TaxID=40149 RepID=A0A0E0E5B4_9ORYZ
MDGWMMEMVLDAAPSSAWRLLGLKMSVKQGLNARPYVRDRQLLQDFSWPLRQRGHEDLVSVDRKKGS